MSRVLTAVGEEAAEQAAAFVQKLVAEEAVQDGLELYPRREAAADRRPRRVNAPGWNAGRSGRAIGVGLSISGMGDRLRLIYRICNELFLKHEIPESIAGLPSAGRVGSPGRQTGDDRVNVSDAAGPSRPPDRALWAGRGSPASRRP